MGDAVTGGPNEVRLGPIRFQLQRWAVGGLSLVAVLLGTALAAMWIIGHFEADKVRVAPAELVQMREAQRHLGESPTREVVLFDDSLRGRVAVKLYGSDLCLLHERVGLNGLRTSTFAVNPDRAGKPPSSSSSSSPFASPAGASVGPLPAGRGCPRETGRCANPHHGAFETGRGARSEDGCWIQVWRRWPDCCEHWQWYNECYDVWDQAINWTYCVH